MIDFFEPDEEPEEDEKFGGDFSTIDYHYY